VPIPDPTAVQKHVRLTGVVPSAIDPPEGCRLNTRCPRRNLLSDPEICLTTPPWQEVNPEHHIYCHVPLEELRKIDPVLNIKGVSRAGLK
jgi:peptide/nickel transport system ATP-binding protein